MRASEHKPQDLQKKLLRVSGMMNIRFRPMFGGVIAYSNGQAFSSLSNRGLALRLSSSDRKLLIESGGVPLQSEPEDPPSTIYTLLPASVLEDETSLHRWLTRSVGYVTSSKPLRPRPNIR